jgi:beta-N-acetylhexosaminidase
MRASRRRILTRRAAAVGIVLFATALIALALRSGDQSAPAPAPVTTGGVPRPVRGLVRRLSLEQKVDQVLALGFAGTDSSSPVVAELGQRQIGALFVGPGNWIDASQGAALIAELKAAGGSGGRLPPLIISAQEGGGQRAFPDLPPARRAAVIGELGDPQRARRWARQAGEALAGVGVDLNLAPVVDLASLGSPLAERVFSEDPQVSASMTLAAEIGCGEARIACAPAHFPGNGAASADTDLGPATVGLSRGTLLHRDLVPFTVAFQVGAPAVVLSLAFFAAYDPVTPASQTPAIVSGLLRRRLGFEGAAITDDLTAGAITALGPVRDAAVASLQAGADLLLIERPGAVQDVTRQAILRASRDGTIPAERLDEAAGRVLELKRQLGLLPSD